MNKRARKALITNMSQLKHGRYIEVELNEKNRVELSVYTIISQPYKLKHGISSKSCDMAVNVLVENFPYVNVRFVNQLIGHEQFGKYNRDSIEYFCSNGIILNFRYSSELFYKFKGMNKSTFVDWMFGREFI